MESYGPPRRTKNDPRGNGRNQDQEQLPLKTYDRYGMSETEWSALSTEQRELHYNRMIENNHHDKCKHPYTYRGIKSDVTDPRLREPYSFDPYSHTPHMEKCLRWGIPPPARYQIDCKCQMCNMKIGVPREGMDSFPTIKAVVITAVVAVTGRIK